MEPITESEYDSDTYMYYDNLTQTVKDKQPFLTHHYKRSHHHHHLHRSHQQHRNPNNKRYSNGMANQTAAATASYLYASKTTNSDIEEATPLLNSTKEHINDPSRSSKVKPCSVSKTALNVILALLTVVSMVTMMVSLPLFTQAMTDGGSDAYLALTISMFWLPFFYFGHLILVKLFIDPNTLLVPKTSWSNIMLVAFFCSLNALAIAFASPPSRTPAYLQSMFTTLQVPYTVIARLIILRKVPSLKQLISIVVLFVGLFIALEPEIFHMNQNPTEDTQKTVTWYWPFIFAIGWLPMAISYVYVEESQQDSEAQTLVYVSYVQLFMYGCIICFFWTDLIPGFGMAKNPAMFFHSVERGLMCFYGADASCGQVPALGAIFILSYSFTNMFNYFMIRYSEAVYSVVVLALATPLGTIFWMFFSPTPYIHWQPTFNTSSIFLVVGLLIMMPAVAAYTYLSIQEETSTNKAQMKTMKARRALLQKQLPPRTRRVTDHPLPAEEWDFRRSQRHFGSQTSKPKKIPGQIKKKGNIIRSKSAPNFVTF